MQNLRTRLSEELLQLPAFENISLSQKYRPQIRFQCLVAPTWVYGLFVLAVLLWPSSVLTTSIINASPKFDRSPSIVPWGRPDGFFNGRLVGV